MARNSKPPYISSYDFDQRVEALAFPALDATHDTMRTAEVLTYLGDVTHWPNWVDEHEKRQFDEKILQAVERADWGLYVGNFVYVSSNLYPYLAECIRREDLFVEDIRKTRFAKICSLAYALVVDVHPDRRGNLRPRIEAWSGEAIDEQAPTMLGALFSAWSRHDAAVVLGNYGSMLSALDPQSSRSALVLNNLLRQMDGNPTETPDSIDIDFMFDSSQ